MVVRFSRYLQDAGRARVLIVALFVAACPQAAFADFPSVPGEYVVEVARLETAGFSDSKPAHVDGADVLGLLSNDGGTLKVRQLATAAAGIQSQGESEDFCATLLKQNSGVVTACSPNYILHASATNPNDPQLASLWGMSASSGIDAPRAWDYSTGSTDEVIAIIDTGIDYTHPDLAANVWSNPAEVPGNGIDDDGNGYVDDIHGINAAKGTGDPMDDNNHGTHVAGTIGAAGNNSVGVVGVNWTAKMMALKFLDASGSGNLADAIKAINYLVVMKNHGVNVRAVNNSWGGGGYSQSLYNAIQKANQAGIIFVAAAGNEGNDNDANPSYPGSYDLSNVVSVAAVDGQGNLASFSNFGATSVGIAAPGVDILSTIPGNRYARFSGTSMAAPHVTGSLGLLFAHEPGLSMAQALDRLYGSGRPLTTLSGTTRTGRLLNVGRMLANDTTPIPEPGSGPTCEYSIEQTSVAPDTSADNGELVITADEMNYHTVALPFSMPWDGGNVNSVTLSPNGVAYMNYAPSGWDYQNGDSAPRNSVAVLHTDLYPVGTGMGVKVAFASDRVTVNWTATHYAVKSGYAVARLTLHSDGSIETWYKFSDSDIESFLKNNSTVGVHGSSASSIATFSPGSSRVHNGMGLKFTPYCAANRPEVRELDLAGQGLHGKATSNISPGKKFTISAFGSGSGTLKLHFALGSQQCKDLAVQNFIDGSMKIQGKLPKNVNWASSLTVKVDGYNKQSRIKVNGVTARQRSARRLSSKALSSVCSNLVRSLR